MWEQFGGEFDCSQIVVYEISDEVLARMTASDLAQAVEKLNNVRGPKVVLTMPKFKIDYKYGNVMDHMRALGVNKIFTPGVGDFGDLFEKVCGSSRCPFIRYKFNYIAINCVYQLFQIS